MDESFELLNKILYLHNSGWTVTEIADQVDLSEYQVTMIINRYPQG